MSDNFCRLKNVLRTLVLGVQDDLFSKNLFRESGLKLGFPTNLSLVPEIFFLLGKFIRDIL